MADLFDVGGHLVSTGLLPNTAEDNLLCANLADFPDDWIYDAEMIKKLLDGDRYKADRAKRKFRMRNQSQLGKCNASANATAVEQIREQQGFQHVELNDCYTYARVNGGRDQGSTLPSTFKDIQNGVAPYRLQVGGLTKEFPNDIYNKSQVDPALWRQAEIESERFKIVSIMRLPLDDFDKFCRVAATAIARGLPIVWAWHVGGNGSRLTNGYMNLGSGPGNHANCIHSGKWVGGKELVHPDNQNSWGPTEDPIYGPKGPAWGESGFALTTMEGLYACAHNHPPYIVISAGIDPNDSRFSI